MLNADGSLRGKPTVTGAFPFTLQTSYRGVRTWAAGTLAASCLVYRTGKRGYEYSVATGAGVYRVQPTG